VTYPYIFAKVRIQARSADIEDDDGSLPHVVGSHHHDKSKHPGAITILTKVLQKEGITGWYQVSEFLLLWNLMLISPTNGRV
jgi:hypothetical protein